MTIRLTTLIVGLMAIGVAFLLAAPSTPALPHYGDHSASAHMHAGSEQLPAHAGMDHHHQAELLQESSRGQHGNEHCPPCYETGPGVLKANTWTRDSDNPVKKSPDAIFAQLASASSLPPRFDKLSLQRLSAPPIHADTILRTGRLRI